MWTICNSLLHLQKFGVNNEPFLNTQYNKTSRVICNSLDKLVFLDHFLSNLYSYFTDPFPRVEFHFSFFDFLSFSLPGFSSFLISGILILDLYQLKERSGLDTSSLGCCLMMLPQYRLITCDKWTNNFVLIFLFSKGLDISE